MKKVGYRNLGSLPYLICLLVPAVFCFCCGTNRIVKSEEIYFQLDSVFINQIESHRTFTDVTYLVYFFSIYNKTTVNLQATIRRYEFQKKPKDRWYIKYKKDTFELFAMSTTYNDIVVKQNSITSIALNTDPDVIVKLFDSLTIAKRTVDVLKPYVRGTKFYFEINGLPVKAVVSEDLKFIFRDPNDQRIVEWK